MASSEEAGSPDAVTPPEEGGSGGDPVAPRPLRIAAHNGAPELGGAEIATALLLKGLRGRGHEVLLFYNREVVADGVVTYGVPTRRGYLGGDIAVHHALRFALQLRRWRPDVLVVGTFRKLWLAALAARLAGVPVVARIGLSTDTPRSAKYRWVFRHWADAVVTNARDLAEAYRAALPAAPPPRIEAVHKGIEAPATTAPRSETRRALGVPVDAPLIGAAGRLVEQKRYDRLLRTVAALPAGVRCVLVGDGPLRPELEAMAAELGLGGRVVFTGHQEEVSDLMAAMDLLVITSDRESLANVMLEALAAGTPVVSTPVSGAAEALGATHGEDPPPADRGADRAPRGARSSEDPRGARSLSMSLPAPGLVVEPDPVALAGAIESLLGAPDRLAEMSESARRTAERRFGSDRMLEAWEAVLGDVVRGAPGSVSRARS